MNSSFRKTLILRRSDAADTVVDGYKVNSATTDTNFLASVQPLNAHQIQHLPESRRNSKSYWLYTSDNLLMMSAKNADRVIIDGEEYEVWKKEPWQNAVLNHFKILVGKVLVD